MTLQKWAGIVISALSIFVIIVNVLYFKNSDAMDHYWSIGLAVVSLGFFGVSIFVESVGFKIIQCILFFIVSVYAVVSETDPILIGIGFFFMFVAFMLVIYYKFVERHPIPIILCSIIGLVLFFYVIFHNIATAAAATCGVSLCFSILWAMSYLSNIQMRKIAKEAIVRGDGLKDALEERLNDGKIHR
jgi:hypothetical protein